MIGPLSLYILLCAVVAVYGVGPVHGFWRLLALSFTFTPVAAFLYILLLEHYAVERP